MSTFNFGGAYQGTGPAETPEPPKVGSSAVIPQIAFDEYGRQVNIFLNSAQKREFDELTDTLAKQYGTKNVTDTVMQCLRDAAAPIEF